MISATQLLYTKIGSPAGEGCIDHDIEPCWLCGGDSTRGAPVDDWGGSSFTGQNKVMHPAGRFVCEPCVAICARSTPVPGRLAKEGKKFGGNFRNYSHLFDGGTYQNASKGEKPLIRAFLAASHTGPWFAAIADSGQKHVIPWAPVNPSSRGVVLFEEMLVRVPRGHEFGLIDHMADILTAGATKDSITTGQYTPGEWQRCEVALRTFEDRWRYLRESPWWRLALWLAQRDEEAVIERMAQEKTAKEGKVKDGKARRSKRGQAPHADGGGAAGDPPRVPDDARCEPDQELGPTVVPPEDQRQDGNERRPLGNADARPHGRHKRTRDACQPCLPGLGK